MSSSLNPEAGEPFPSPTTKEHVACGENMDYAANEPNVLSALPSDIREIILVKAEFASLYQMLHVSKSFQMLAAQAIKVLYCIQRGEKAYLNYTAILRELGALIQDAAKGVSIVEANKALESSVRYLCIKAVLEAQFGYCILYTAGQLPKFTSVVPPFDILNDPRRVSVLPHLLDEMPFNVTWSSFTSGLAVSEQFDVLSHMTFSKICASAFDSLMSAPLPTAIVLAAAKALRKNDAEQASGLLAFAEFGEQPTQLPEDCKVPLCILPHLLELKGVLPNNYTLVDGLERASCSFWRHVFETEAEELLALVVEHGDNKTRRLAQAFYGPVPIDDFIYNEPYVYGEMLIRFRFSPICNEHVLQNYDIMLRELPPVCTDSALVFLEYEQHQLYIQHKGDERAYELDRLIDKLWRLKKDSLKPFIRDCVERHEDALLLLKRLIQRRADDAYAQLVWESIRDSVTVTVLDKFYCYASVAELKRLVFERDVSAEHVERTLIMAGQSLGHGGGSVDKVQLLSIVMFWEAPEYVIEHFLSQVPGNYKLVQGGVSSLLRLKKYSIEFCTRLIRRCEKMDSCCQYGLRRLRPDLAAELSPHVQQ